MRTSLAASPVLLLLACGEVSSGTDAAAVDAAATDGPAIDAAVDAPACTPRPILIGGQPVMPQGWTVVQSGAAALTLGPDYVRLETATVAGATSGAQLLLSYPGAVDPNQPFAVSFVALVEAVSPHNPLDAAAAIMASFTGGFGNGTDRAEMLYLDANAIGFADDTARQAFTVTDNAYHTYRLDSDGAGTLKVSVDGALVLTRPGFTSNGALAFGDQTNDANVEARLRLRSVMLLCP